MTNNNLIFYLMFFLVIGLMVSCGDDDPVEMENEDEEIISRITLTFTPDNGEDAIVALWFDADGEGSGAPMIDEIELEEGVSYSLSLELTNTLGSTDDDITSEIQEEAEEHMFFYSFTDGIFSDPTGNGNVDNRSDAINYGDQDANGLPLGLLTNWTAGAHTDAPGEFNIILKHQPDGLKTANSDVTVGGTDVNVTFPLMIIEGNVEEEVINQIVLNFTPAGGGDAVTAMWFDADGEGVGNPTIDDINLAQNTTYELSLSLANTLGMDVEDITEEIMEEADEHMFFFEFTTDIFSDPSGDGNLDNRSDSVNYNDQDGNNLPVGLMTNWTTGGVTATPGSFRIILKHQPGLKTSNSDATVGGTDVDISFPINIL